MNSQDIAVPMSGTLDEPPNPFVELVFSIPLLLEKILSAYASDLKTLLNLRLVSKTWKGGVYSSFLNNLSILPTIVACSPEYLDEDEQLLMKTPESFCEKFPSGSGFSGFPLKLVLGVSPVSRQAVVKKLLQGHADKVVCLKYYHNFVFYEGKSDAPNEDYFQFEFPMLKHAKLSCMSLSTEASTSTNFGKLLVLYNQVVESSHILNTLEVGVSFSKDNPLPFDDPSLKLLPFAKITSLASTAAFLDKLHYTHSAAFITLATTHFLPKLKEVQFCLDEDSPISSVVRSQLLLEKGENLTNIVILPYTNVEIGYLKELRRLKICTDSSVRCGLEKDTPIPELIPNLTKLWIESNNGASKVLSAFTSSGLVFNKVIQLILNENSATSCTDPMPDFDRVSACLHRLKSLRWRSRRSIRKVIPATQYMFSNLQHITELLLWCNMDEFGIRVDPLREIFMLLTSMYPEEIPENPVTWKTALEGRPTAICNLKNLKTFQLYTKYSSLIWSTYLSNKMRSEFATSNIRPVVPERESRFLFHAAFNQMDSLKVIKINTVSFDDNCITQWMESGRKFVGDWIPMF